MTPERICELRNVFTQAFAFGRESEVCIEAHEGLHLLAEAEAAERMREAGVNLRQAVQVYWPDDKPKPRFMELAIVAMNEALSITPPAEAEKGERE